MAVFARFMGWLAIAVGIVAAILPYAVDNALAPGEAMMIAFVGVFTGVGLVVMAKLLTIAEKIEEHTNWFSGSARPAPAAVGDSSQPERGLAGDRREQAVEPEAGASDEPAGEPQPDAIPEPVERTPEPAPQGVPEEERRPAEIPAPAPRPAAPPADIEPEVYDAGKHPPAIEEWAYEDLRVMTLQDGSVAVELDGIWYRFSNVEDMLTYLSPASSGQE